MILYLAVCLFVGPQSMFGCDGPALYMDGQSMLRAHGRICNCVELLENVRKALACYNVSLKPSIN